MPFDHRLTCFNEATILGDSVVVPVFDETGKRRTHAEISKLSMDVSSAQRCINLDSTYSHNYVADKLESRRNKIKPYDCPEMSRTIAMRARLQDKLARKK